MLVADTFLGNTAEEQVAARVERDDPLSVTLSDTERRRSRVRTTADDGTDLGIVVSEPLADGDVLLADERTVIVSLATIEALALTFKGPVQPSCAVELGHAIGNRHWDLAIDDGRVLLPIVEDRERMEAVIDALMPRGTTTAYVAVPPTTFDATEGHGGSHDHSHDDSPREHEQHRHDTEQEHGRDHHWGIEGSRTDPEESHGE
jgi:urease accessory protein